VLLKRAGCYRNGSPWFGGEGISMTKSKPETKLIKGDLVLTKDTVFNMLMKKGTK
jgi:hypothetical protein